MSRIRGSAALRSVAGALAVLCALASGCGRGSLVGVAPPNQPPVLKISDSTVRSVPGSVPRGAYTVTFGWNAFDPDGSVDHFEYAMSAAETSVVDPLRNTRRHELTLAFGAADSALAATPADSAARNFQFEGFHEFLVRAVDNMGAKSAWDGRFFNSVTIAPTTQLKFPVGSPPRSDITGAAVVSSVPVAASLLARWQGTDPDAFDGKAKPRRYHLFFADVTPIPQRLFAYDADHLIRVALATGGFYVGGDTISRGFNLTVGHTYCLVVKSVDEAGAEEPLPSLRVPVPTPDSPRNLNSALLGKNVSIFTALPNQASPTLNVTAGTRSDIFTGYDATRRLSVEVPVGSDVSVSWTGAPSPGGAAIVGYRYALDIDDPTSDRPVVTQAGGFSWTPMDARSTFAVLPAYARHGTHNFYIQALDDADSRTTAAVALNVIEAEFDRPLLFVMDDPYLSLGPGTTPSMTLEETLDFWRDIVETDRYYLRKEPGGDKKCAPMAGAMDVYRPRDYSGSNGVPLSVLSHYRVVMWYSPRYSVIPGYRSALHDMVTGYSHTPNNLFTYMQFGGHIWIYGGGVITQMATTSSIPYPLVGTSVTRVGTFCVDALGLNGADTVSNVFLADRSTPTHNQPEYNPQFHDMTPAPVPFVRRTAYGLRAAQIPALDFDVARYDTLPPGRRGDNLNVANLMPNVCEYLRGTPDNVSANRDSAFWQPIAIYHPVGPLAESNIFSGKRLAIEGSVTGWYVRGTSLLAPQGFRVRAPYELYYFGVPLHLLNREQVRGLADVIFSTDGWNIWRGGCPPAAGGRLAGESAPGEVQPLRDPDLKRGPHPQPDAGQAGEKTGSHVQPRTHPRPLQGQVH